MAERRMFAKTIIDSDAFIDMPLSTQALYFHLSMRADDDGFINNPKKIQRMIGATDDDLKLLLAKRYILAFDSGVIVIKHWKIHNYIQKDRYKPTVYIEEKSSLKLKDNGSYTECIQDGYNLETQDRIGKVSIGKVSIEEDSINKEASPLDEFPDEVQDAIKSFMAMRKKQKKPMTENAIKRLVKKLKDLSSDPQEQIKILNQSEDACWLDIYPLKQDKQKSSNKGDNIFLQIGQEEGII